MMSLLKMVRLFLKKEMMLAFLILELIADGIGAVPPLELGGVIYDKLPKKWKAPLGPATRNEFLEVIARGIDFYRALRHVLT